MAIPTVPPAVTTLQAHHPLPDDVELIAAAREALEILALIDNPPTYLRPEDQSAAFDELDARRRAALERVYAMTAQTPAGLAAEMRVEFCRQSGAPWAAAAMLRGHVTPEQLAELEHEPRRLWLWIQALERMAWEQALAGGRI